MSAASQAWHVSLQTPASSPAGTPHDSAGTPHDSAGTTRDSASSRRQHTPACTAFCSLFSGYLLQSRNFHAFSPPEARLQRIYKSFIIYQLLFPMRISSSSFNLVHKTHCIQALSSCLQSDIITNRLNSPNTSPQTGTLLLVSIPFYHNRELRP